MENTTKLNEKYDKLFSGGLQKHFQLNEARIYKNLFTLDVASYCLKDYSNNNLSEDEISCVELLGKKNLELFKASKL